MRRFQDLLVSVLLLLIAELLNEYQITNSISHVLSVVVYGR